MSLRCFYRSCGGIPRRLFLSTCLRLFQPDCRMASNVSTRDVRDVLVKQYGIVPHHVARMNGYYNLNFEVTLADKAKVGYPVSEMMNKGRKFIMKFVDTTHQSYCGNIELQHASFKHLHANKITTSYPVAMKSGDTITQFTGGTERKTYIVQLLTYIEGLSFNEADLGREEAERICADLGRLLGHLHQALTKHDYSIDQASAMYSSFHVQNALDFRDKADFVADERTKELLKKYFKLFEDNFLPRLGELRKGFIHGDFSDSNVILQRAAEDGAVWEIAGVIDLEECAYGYLIGDFGICVAYLMLKAVQTEGADPIKVSQLVIQAYQTVMPLTESEKAVLFEVVTSRMAVSYASASYEASLNHGNNEYLFSQAKSVPTMLEMIEKTGRSAVEKAWFGSSYRSSLMEGLSEANYFARNNE